MNTKGCPDAAIAYAEMYNKLYDLIISDIMMPGTDGFECFGRQPSDKVSISCNGSKVMLHLKRDRKIIWLCVLLAIPGFIGWILPYFIYKKILSKRSETVTPLIEAKYDEIYEICEKGSKLL